MSGGVEQAGLAEASVQAQRALVSAQVGIRCLNVMLALAANTGEHEDLSAVVELAERILPNVADVLEAAEGTLCAAHRTVAA